MIINVTISIILFCSSVVKFLYFSMIWQEFWFRKSWLAPASSH